MSKEKDRKNATRKIELDKTCCSERAITQVRWISLLMLIIRLCQSRHVYLIHGHGLHTQLVFPTTRLLLHSSYPLKGVVSRRQIPVHLRKCKLAQSDNKRSSGVSFCSQSISDPAGLREANAMVMPRPRDVLVIPSGALGSRQGSHLRSRQTSDRPLILPPPDALGR